MPETLADVFGRVDRRTVQDRLTEWSGIYGVRDPEIVGFRVENWTADRVAQQLLVCAQYVPRLITDKKPRQDYGPLVYLDFGGRLALIDGRRRSNLLSHKKYKAWIVEVSGC